MSETALAIPPEQQEEILRYLGLNPDDMATKALVQICNRYGFDPLLKHVVLIGGKGQGKNTYVTRDGLLHLAHQSHQLDGIQVVDEGDNDNEWWAVVRVHRKDMSHPFQYKGRYAKSSMNKAYGPEMAVKCAEVMALRRAFDVSLPTVEEQWDTVSGQVGSVEPLQEHHVPDTKEVLASVPVGSSTTSATRIVVTERVSPKAAIAEARGHLESTKVSPGPRLRGQIRAMMARPGIEREHRDEFRDLWGPVDDLDGNELVAASQWVIDKIAELGVEPF
jgi:hypothetical protein